MSERCAVLQLLLLMLLLLLLLLLPLSLLLFLIIVDGGDDPVFQIVHKSSKQHVADVPLDEGQQVDT